MTGDPAGRGVLGIAVANVRRASSAGWRTIVRPARRERSGTGPSPHVNMSPRGTRIIFTSDWNNGSTVDTYVVELPSYAP